MEIPTCLPSALSGPQPSHTARDARLRLHLRPCLRWPVSAGTSPAVESVPSHALLPTGCRWGNSCDLKTFTKPPRPVPRCVFSSRTTHRGTGQSFALYCTQEHPFTNAPALCTRLFYNSEALGPCSVLRSLPACTQPPFGHRCLGQGCGWHSWCSRAGRRCWVAQGGDAVWCREAMLCGAGRRCSGTARQAARGSRQARLPTATVRWLPHA